jgi:hypothetical protein
MGMEKERAKTRNFFSKKTMNLGCDGVYLEQLEVIFLITAVLRDLFGAHLSE